MGKATIDQHSQKEHTKLYRVFTGTKSPSLELIGLVQLFENVKIYKEMYGHSHPDAVPIFKWLYLSRN